MKKQTLLWVVLLVIGFASCKKATDTPPEPAVYKEVIEKRVSVVDDGYNINPLTVNPDGTLSGSLYGVPLIFSNVTYPLYDEAGLPMPDRTGDPFIAEVALDPSNTVGASVVDNDGESFTILFFGYLSGGCNATPTTLSFDFTSYTDKQNIEWDDYQTKLTEYLAKVEARRNDPSLPKPVLPIRKTTSLKSYFLGPVCAQSHTVTAHLIRMEGNGFGLKFK